MSGNVHHTTVDFFRARLCVCVCLLVCAQYARVCVFAMADWAEKSAGWRVGEPPKLEGPTNQPPKPHLPAQLVRQTQEMRRTPNQSQTQTLQGINGKQCVVCQTTHLFPFIPCKIIKYIPRSWIMDCSYLNQKQQRRRTKTHEFVWHAWARSAQFDQSMKKKQANAGSGQKFLKKRPLYIVFRTKSWNFQKWEAQWSSCTISNIKIQLMLYTGLWLSNTPTPSPVVVIKQARAPAAHQ